MPGRSGRMFQVQNVFPSPQATWMYFLPRRRWQYDKSFRASTKKFAAMQIAAGPISIWNYGTLLLESATEPWRE